MPGTCRHRGCPPGPIGNMDYAKAALQAPQTYALQQQLNFKGSGPMQRLFRANDPSGRGILPLEDLTHCCQAVSPGEVADAQTMLGNQEQEKCSWEPRLIRQMAVHAALLAQQVKVRKCQACCVTIQGALCWLPLSSVHLRAQTTLRGKNCSSGFLMAKLGQTNAFRKP
eukprot:933434-Pelagomonas_calceolata.AAC.17